MDWKIYLLKNPTFRVGNVILFKFSKIFFSPPSDFLEIQLDYKSLQSGSGGFGIFKNLESRKVAKENR
jgi:hypothetical protein